MLDNLKNADTSGSMKITEHLHSSYLYDMKEYNI
jgi:hypothetical protein